MTQASTGPGTPWGQLQNAIHLVTLRLAGIIPAVRLKELRVWRDEQLALAPTEPRLARDFQTRIRQRYFTEYDYLLDENRDNILLADARVSAMLRRQLMQRCGALYRPLAYCVMPNHVHAVLEVIGAGTLPPHLDDDDDLDFSAIRADETPDERSPLVDFLRGYKRETATEAFALLDDGRELAWHPESFDFWIRSDSELEAVIDYIAQNPVEAGLVQSPEQWFYCSAHERYLHDATTNGWLPRDT